MALPVFSQTPYRLGFCSGKVVTKGAFSVEGASALEAAIFLSPDVLSRFTGDRISGVNAGLASKMNVHDMTVWVRESLDGENIAETTIDIRTTPKPRDGWNNLNFDSSVEIKENTGYYVGYTLNLTKTSSPVSAVDGHIPGASFIRTGDDDWSDRDEIGILSIEALISGDNLPANDLRLMSASFSKPYCVADSPMELSYEIRNEGIDPVTSYELTVEAAGTGLMCVKEIRNTINYGVTRNYAEEISITGLEAGKEYDFTVTIAMPNGKEDETPGDNRTEINGIHVIESVFPRTVLLEEFTTEQCSNCPAAAQTVMEMTGMMSEDRKSRFVMVCHHSGYYEDAFTLDCDRDYLWFFNNGSATYAPAFMLDRMEQTASQTPTPVFQNLPPNDFLHQVSAAQDSPALYSISIDGSHDADRRTVHVDIAGDARLQMFPDPRVTVYLVEDNVPASNRGQAGAGKDYIHNHVERAYNSAWGESPEWEDDSYMYSCTLSYPEGCKPEDMHVVAFISNYNPDDPTDCHIGNASEKKLSELENASVNNPSASDGVTSIEIRDIHGRLLNTTGDVSGLIPGIYLIIRKTSGSTSAKTIIKGM